LTQLFSAKELRDLLTGFLMLKCLCSHTSLDFVFLKFAICLLFYGKISFAFKVLSWWFKQSLGKKKDTKLQTRLEEGQKSIGVTKIIQVLRFLPYLIIAIAT
jgi:hypothetical protein